MDPLNECLHADHYRVGILNVAAQKKHRFSSYVTLIDLHSLLRYFSIITFFFVWLLKRLAACPCVFYLSATSRMIYDTSSGTLSSL